MDLNSHDLTRIYAIAGGFMCQRGCRFAEALALGADAYMRSMECLMDPEGFTHELPHGMLTMRVARDREAATERLVMRCEPWPPGEEPPPPTSDADLAAQRVGSWFPPPPPKPPTRRKAPKGGGS